MLYQVEHEGTNTLKYHPGNKYLKIWALIDSILIILMRVADFFQVRFILEIEDKFQLFAVSKIQKEMKKKQEKIKSSVADILQLYLKENLNQGGLVRKSSLLSSRIRDLEYQ